MTSHACFLSSEPVQEGRPAQSPSQLPPARLWEEPRFQVQNPGEGAHKWAPGEALTGGRGRSSPSLGTSGLEIHPSYSLHPGGLCCRSCVKGGSPRHGYHPPFQLTPAPAPSSRLGWQVTSVWGRAGPGSADCTCQGGGPSLS